MTGASFFIGQLNSSSQKVCCNCVTAEKLLMHESKTAFLWREGGLLFISRPFIPVITGLVKGKMYLPEFYRTAIIAYLLKKRIFVTVKPLTPPLRKANKGYNRARRDGRVVDCGGLENR